MNAHRNVRFKAEEQQNVLLMSTNGSSMLTYQDFMKAKKKNAVFGRYPCNAMGWYEKGVLLEEDLAEIQAKIDEKNTPVEEVEPIEEVVEDNSEA